VGITSGTNVSIRVTAVSLLD